MCASVSQPPATKPLVHLSEDYFDKGTHASVNIDQRNHPVFTLWHHWLSHVYEITDCLLFNIEKHRCIVTRSFEGNNAVISPIVQFVHQNTICVLSMFRKETRKHSNSMRTARFCGFGGGGIWSRGYGFTLPRPPWTELQKPVKALHSRNFVCGR